MRAAFIAPIIAVPILIALAVVVRHEHRHSAAKPHGKASSSLAATAPPGKPDPSLAVAGHYAIDSAHSQLLFTVTHFGFSNYTGQFTNPTGTLILDPKNPAADKVDVTFPIDNVQTTVPALDAHLKSADFFDAERFPTAHFVSTKVEVNGVTARITGNLTLKGITKPIVLDAHLVGAGKMDEGSPKSHHAGFTATATLRRSDFGITEEAPMVSDTVALTINTDFTEQ